MEVLILLFLVAGYAAALMIDWVIVLLFLRVISVRWRVTLISELADSGRPLVDRTTAVIQRVWDAALPNRTLHTGHLWMVTALALSVARLVIAITLNQCGFDSSAGESG